MKIVIRKIEPKWARHLLLLFAMVTGSAWAFSAIADTTYDSDHPAVVVATRLNNAIAEGDADTLRSFIAPEVLIFESGGVESSFAEYEAHHMPADMEFMKNMQREVSFRRVIESGDSVVVMTKSNMSGVYKEKEYDLSNTETLVMNNIAGQWKVVHIHWSSR